MKILDDNARVVELWRIISAHGYRGQKEKAVEELCELATELARDLQGDGVRAAITEEMADVYLMLGQLELMYGNAEEVRRTVEEKLARTLRRMNAETELRTEGKRDFYRREHGDQGQRAVQGVPVLPEKAVFAEGAVRVSEGADPEHVPEDGRRAEAVEL